MLMIQFELLLGRPKECITSKIKKTINKYQCPELKRDGNNIICSVCSTKVEFEEETLSIRVKNHISTANHKNNLDRNKSNPQQLITATFKKQQKDEETKSEFKTELAQLFLAADICLSKLELPIAKRFLIKWTKQIVPHSTTLRKYYVEPKYQKKNNMIRNLVGNHPVYSIGDETQDTSQRYVVNVMVGVLNGESRRAMLLDT